MILGWFRKLEYYESIDTMPIYNWFKLQETNDLKYLLHDQRKVSKRQVLKLQEALQKITDEYIDAFGISEQHRTILELKRDIRAKEIEYLVTKQRINRTFIRVLKDKLKATLETNQRNDSTSVWVHAKKYMGGNLDMKTTSVKEFYTILNEFRKEVESSSQI